MRVQGTLRSAKPLGHLLDKKRLLSYRQPYYTVDLIDSGRVHEMWNLGNKEAPLLAQRGFEYLD